MNIYLTLNQTEDLIKESSNPQQIQLINDCLKYDISIKTVLNHIEDYINEYEPFYKYDFRDAINAGLIYILACDNVTHEEYKEAIHNNYYVMLKSGVYLIFE